ncbi:hypothetical protein MRX96_019120 [Rhipicephalus microplus]
MSDQRLFSCHRRDHFTIHLEDDCFRNPPPTSRFSHPPRHCKGWCWHRHLFRGKCRLGGVSHPFLRSATEEACGIYRHCTGARKNAGLGSGSQLRPAFPRSSAPAWHLLALYWRQGECRSWTWVTVPSCLPPLFRDLRGIYRYCTGGRENAGLGRGSRFRPAFHRSSGPATAKAWEVDR